MPQNSPQPVGRRFFVRPSDRLIHLADVHQRLKDGAKLSALAEEYGVTPSALSQNLNKAGLLTWKTRSGRPRKEPRP
ncbi:hypothetical protein [Azospirillum argentinense]|uniref:Uncharacterized protein n=1 Tax=Azospirillum brasilense TaxID=192 RepID=A0A4D8Q5A4_AZOBR|nr:hypothetical protein [Azospirillum argentinense]QCO05465.1 hypothetical protein D3867_26330 [Azospirillum argentinense]